MTTSSNAELAEALIRRHLQIQRVSSHEVNLIVKKLKALAKELSSLTLLINPSELNRLEWRNKRVKKLMDEGRKIIGSRFDEMLTMFRDEMYKLAEQEASYTENLLMATLALKKQGGKGTGEAKAIELVNGSYIEGGLLTDWFSRMSESYRMGFQKEVYRGTVAGESSSEISERIMGGKDEPSLYDRQKRGIETFIRTAVMVMANEVRMMCYERFEEHIACYQWIAVLDGKTCVTCANRDMKTWDINRKPLGHELEFSVPPKHYGCRCILTPVLRLWDDNGDMPSSEDFADWFDKQDSGFKRDYLGKGRYELYKSGKMTFSDLVTQKGRPMTVKELGG